MKKLGVVLLLITLWTCHEPILSFPSREMLPSRYDFCYFGGLANPWDRNPSTDSLAFPHLEGLRIASCYEFCEKDTCYAKRVVFALRCPEEKPLLRFAASRADSLYRWCLQNAAVEKDSLHYDACSSLDDIVDSCIEKITHIVRQEPCYDDEQDTNEQFGMCLFDIGDAMDGKYVTFLEWRWYDHLSTGNTITQSWFSVDRITGKAATLSDFIDSRKYPALADILLLYLRDSYGSLWTEGPGEDDSRSSVNILLAHTSVAITNDWFIVSYDPYVIGYGVDGIYQALIPTYLLNFLI